jgi:glucan phosphoethanolaminetransferase (alkaline phosphatase superfamily)
MNEKRQSVGGETEKKAHPSAIATGLWLGVVFIGTKAAILGTPHSAQWLANLALITPYDVLFALGVGVAGEVALSLTKGRPRLHRALRTAFLGFCVLCAFYAVVAVGVWSYFNRPLTVDILRVVQSLRAVRSSITEQLTIPMAVALLAVPAVFVGLTLLGRRIRIPKTAFVAAAGWIIAGYLLEPTRPLAVSPKLILSPHLELARSVARAWGPPKLVLPATFPPEDALELRSFAAREGEPKNSFVPPPGVPRPRNVIFVVLESVGTKYLSLYGSRYDTTPNLVAESAHALVGKDCYAQASYTYHSFMALNFSIYPGLPWCHAPWGGRPCPPTLAAILEARGWRTAYLHSGDLDWGATRWHLEGHGYGTIEDHHNFGCVPLTSWGTEDRCVFERLISWIDEKPGQPFFALCWTDQTHDPYKLVPGFEQVDFFHGNPPRELAPELGRYLNIVHAADRQLGLLFAALRERGIADDTIVVITGDHGEGFRDPHDQRGHGFTIYQEDVNVPLIIWNPRLFSPGKRLTEVCGHIDLNPTIADLLGVSPSREWQGYSLFDPRRPSRAFFLTDAGEYLFGLREGPWKYLFEATDGKERLFDLSKDPDELHSVAAAEPERCQRMRQRIAAFVSFEEAFLRGHAD